jgi:hypothetical protein
MFLNKFVNSNTGKYVMSIILGLGLSALFREVCKDKKCYIYKPVEHKYIDNKIFKADNKCYKYNQVTTKCNSNLRIINA